MFFPLLFYWCRSSGLCYGCCLKAKYQKIPLAFWNYLIFCHLSRNYFFFFFQYSFPLWRGFDFKSPFMPLNDLKISCCLRRSTAQRVAVDWHWDECTISEDVAIRWNDRTAWAGCLMFGKYQPQSQNHLGTNITQYNQNPDKNDHCYVLARTCRHECTSRKITQAVTAEETCICSLPRQIFLRLGSPILFNNLTEDFRSRQELLMSCLWGAVSEMNSRAHLQTSLLL